jgi:hypothetical protein
MYICMYLFMYVCMLSAYACMFGHSRGVEVSEVFKQEAAVYSKLCHVTCYLIDCSIRSSSVNFIRVFR